MLPSTLFLPKRYVLDQRQLRQKAPENFGSTFALTHRYQTTSSRNPDDCDTSQLHFPIDLKERKNIFCDLKTSQHFRDGKLTLTDFLGRFNVSSHVFICLRLCIYSRLSSFDRQCKRIHNDLKFTILIEFQ